MFGQEEWPYGLKVFIFYPMRHYKVWETIKGIGAKVLMVLVWAALLIILGSIIALGMWYAITEKI